jgi:hypothetical protein
MRERLLESGRKITTHGSNEESLVGEEVEAVPVARHCVSQHTAAQKRRNTEDYGEERG